MHTFLGFALGFCVTAFAFVSCWVTAAPLAKKGAGYRLELLSLGFELPVHAAIAPGEDGKIYVVEQAGRVRIWSKSGIEKRPFLDIRSQVRAGGEMGLLSLAFHPQYATNHRFFVNYTADLPNLKTVISEFDSVSKKEKKLLEIDQPYTNHNGGHILFDKEGYLFVGMGDGGSAADPGNRAQDKATLLGKILRLDVSISGTYQIPKDNPFQNPKERGEIYAYGMRNPWRLSFDRITGKLWAGDVGQDTFEEIDIIERGKNYGWRKMEGKHCFNPSRGCESTELVAPVWEYGRDDGISVTGGVVYRGRKMGSLAGTYLFADYGSGKLWGLRWDGKRADNRLLVETGEAISSFAELPDGEVLVISHGGKIFKLVGPS